MSELLDEIINLAADSKESLPSILRKCLILGHELKNERLRNWANQELNGYDSRQSVPEYRILSVHLLGDFSGPFGSGAKNMPLPAYLLKEGHREWGQRVFLAQPIGTLQALATKHNATVSFPWPGDLVAMYQDTYVTQNGMALVAAKQVLAVSAIVGILDTVRNRTLNMALELKAELGTSYKDLHRAESPEIGAKIQHIIFQNTGGNTNVAFGSSNVDASGQVQNTITVGDRESLDRALLNAGLDKADLESLSQSMKADGNKLGARVTKWAKEKGAKVLSAGISVRQQVGTELLLKYLEMHFGIRT